MIKRTVHIARNHEEAEQWDIRQHTQMTHEERQQAARALKERVYGKECPDVRDAHPSHQSPAKWKPVILSRE